MTVTNVQKRSNFDLLQMAMSVVINADSAQDLCRELVHSDFLGGVVRGAFLYALDNRSNLIEIAAYGERFDQSKSEISVWDENPASNAVKHKQDFFIRGDITENSKSVLSLPLTKSSSPEGALVLVLRAEEEFSPLPPEVAKGLGSLCAYFLETKVFPNATHMPKISGTTIEDLTSRQVAILAFMGDGFTNAEISTKVLLSESTVRQETIRIYRALGVSGRLEAVAKARALGLIPKLTFNTPQH